MPLQADAGRPDGFQDKPERLDDPATVTVSQEERGWFVQHDRRIGPFFAKTGAMDLAADIASMLRQSGMAADIRLIHLPCPPED